MDKDWTGNSKSVYYAIGASNHTEKERASDDFYATDSRAIDYLLEKATLDHNLWECACGEGHLSKRLIELGYNVRSTDLIYRGFGEGGWTSSVFMRLLTGILLQTHHTNMLISSWNTPWNSYQRKRKSLCS